MSLFTSALAGAGRAAGEMADTWIKREAAEKTAVNLEQLRADIEQRKARLVNELAIDRDARTRAAQRADRDAEFGRQLRIEGGEPLADKVERVLRGERVRMPEGPGEGVDSPTVPEQLSADEKAAVKRAQLGKDAYHFGEWGVGDRATGEQRLGEIGEARRAMVEAQARAAEANVPLREAQADAAAARANATRTNTRADTSLRDASQAVEVARRALKDAESTALEVLLRNNPNALAMTAEQRQDWLMRNDRVRQATEALRIAEDNRRRLLQQREQNAPAALPEGVSREDAIAQARAAIARGADRAAVVKRLESFGVSGHGL